MAGPGGGIVSKRLQWLVVLAFVFGFGLILFACSTSGVRTSPYVEYERRVESSQGQSVLLGVSFSPEPEKDPRADMRLEPWTPPEPEPEPQEERPEVEIETPWGPITVGGSALGFAAGWIASRRLASGVPQPKEEA